MKKFNFAFDISIFFIEVIWEAIEKIYIDRGCLSLREHTFVSCEQTLPSVKIDYSWLINVWRWKWWVIPATMSHEELWDDTGTGLWWEDSDSIVIMWLLHHLSQTPGLDNLKAFKLNMNEKIRIIQVKFRQNHESTNIDIFKIIFSWECLFLYFISIIICKQIFPPGLAPSSGYLSIIKCEADKEVCQVLSPWCPVRCDDRVAQFVANSVWRRHV